MKTSWKDTTWSESEIMKSQKSKFTNQTHSDIHVLDSKTIGPSSTHDKKREDPQFAHFGGSFQEHGSHDLSLQVKQDQSWEPLTAVQRTDERGVALPEFIGTLGGDASAALTSKVEVAGMKTSWKETTWSESEIMESQKSKFTNQTHSDIHVLDSKTIGPSSTHDKKREDPQFAHFGGSFQEHGSHDLSLQVKQDQSWEPVTASSSTVQYSKSGGEKHQKKGKLEKEYSVASDNDDTVEDKKSSIRELKEYSVVSESEDKDGKEWTKRITSSSTVVVSLEKNEEVSAAPPTGKTKNEEKQETPKSEVSKPCPTEEPAEEPKTYTRKKKKGKKDNEDKEKDVDTSLETTVVGTSADLQMKG